MAEILPDRKVDVACIQETQWKGSGCRFSGAGGKRYKLFLMGGKEISDGAGIFIAEKWVDYVVSIERHSERVMILKTVIQCVPKKWPHFYFSNNSVKKLTDFNDFWYVTS